MPDISKLDGMFKTQQLIAAVVIVALLLLILIGLDVRARGAAGEPKANRFPLAGRDNRASTSLTVAFIWTMVVAYCLLTLVLIATLAPTTDTPVPPDHIPVGWIEAAFQPLDRSVLVQLGIPLGSAVAAQAVVSHKTRERTQQKSISQESSSVAELVSDDEGNLDLVDLQYMIFGVIAAAFILLQFIGHPSRGIGIVPPVFTTLIGASAAVFVGNKLLASNPATIDPLAAQAAAPGGEVVITGTNLIVGDASRQARPTITLSPIDTNLPAPKPISADEGSTSRAVRFTVPGDLPLNTQWKVTLVTNAGSPVTSPTPLRIASPPIQAGPTTNPAWIKAA